MLHTLISPWLFPFFLRLSSQFSSNITCILFGNDEGINQFDFSNPVLDLAPACNLVNERDVGTIKYKLRSLEQSSCSCSSKFYVKVKLVDRPGTRAVDLGGAKV